MGRMPAALFQETPARGPWSGPEPQPEEGEPIRDAVLAQPDHAAWRVLERPRVKQLLASEPAALDEMSRYYVWRLATVFGPTA